MTTKPPYSARDLLIRGKLGVGRYLCDLRNALGLTTRDAAPLVGLSPAMVSQIETGLAALPSARAMDFAMAYAVDPLEFGLIVLSFGDPYIFAMIFPNAVVDPFNVPDDDRKRAEATLDRLAHRRRLVRLKSAATKR